MKKAITMRSIATMLCALALATVPTTSQALLEVTLDSGLGTQTFTDMDDNGAVDFDVTLNGIFQAQGTAKATLDSLVGKMALAPLFPNPTAVFRNLSASPQTFTITIKSPTATTPIAAPLGWHIHYNTSVDDLVDMSVDVPSHSVTAKVAAGAVTLGTLNGTALTAAGDVAEELHGVDPANGFNDMWIVWTISLGANDEFRVGSDNGFDNDSIQLNVVNQAQKCIDKMNNNARKVGDAAQKSDAKCTREVGMDATACVDDTADEKTDKKADKLIDDYNSYCGVVVPGWGVNDDTCCVGGTADGDACATSATCGGGTCYMGGCIAAATDGAANDLTHDLFGPTVAISSDKTTAKCQAAAAKALGKAYIVRWKEFRGCKKENFSSITDDLLLRSTCLEPQPDADGKIGKIETRASDTFQKKCLDKGLAGLGTLFPGACSAEADGAFGACAVRQARCRFCESANIADDIVPAADCDSFDDSMLNGSCP